MQRSRRAHHHHQSQALQSIDTNAIDTILCSQKSVKDIRLSVKAEFFTVEWANSDDNNQERYTGVLTRWKDRDAGEVFIKWEPPASASASSSFGKIRPSSSRRRILLTVP